jgi:hypothetical protein
LNVVLGETTLAATSLTKETNDFVGSLEDADGTEAAALLDVFCIVVWYYEV